MRIDFFKTLVQFISKYDCHNFVLFGEFNVVLSSEERLAVHGLGSTSEEFVELVKSHGLQDLPLIGCEFTFFESGVGVARSWHDRFLVRDEGLGWLDGMIW